MQCRKCFRSECGSEDCDYCEGIEIIGLCQGCHTDENCKHCGKKIDLSSVFNHVKTVGWDFYCNRKCYDKRKEASDAKDN
jgi:hypothetical protein